MVVLWVMLRTEQQFMAAPTVAAQALLAMETPEQLSTTREGRIVEGKSESLREYALLRKEQSTDAVSLPARMTGTTFQESDHDHSEASVWKDAAETGMYPVLHRDHVLSETPLCGAGRLAQGWTPRTGGSPQLIPNTDCSTFPLIQTKQTANGSEPDDTNDKLTLFLIYYENIPLLSKQIDSWLQWPLSLRRRYRFLLIDDGSRVGSRAMDLVWPHREWLLKQQEIDLQVYQIEQDLGWNIGGARNLAAHVVTTDYMVLSDCDMSIPASTAEYLLGLRDQAKEAVGVEATRSGSNGGKDNGGKHLIFGRFRRLKLGPEQVFKPHPAIMLSSRETYWRIGGCDEDFVGRYGHTDVHFFWRAERTDGVKILNQDDVMKDRGIDPILAMDDDDETCVGWAQATCERLKGGLAGGTTTGSGGVNATDVIPKRKRSKEVAPNRRLYQKKTKEEIPWSNEYLRFSWNKAKMEP